MTRTDKNEKLIQQLRAQSSPKIVNIFTRVDNTTGERYILWGSIQVCYENAKCIKENGNLVEFMTNDTDEVIIPRRISYHPGVILDVVMKDVELGVTAAQGVYSRHTGISVNRADHSSEADQTMSEYNYLREQDTATIASEQQASHFAITTEKASRRSIIAQSAEQAAVAQQNTQEYLRLYTSYVEANVSGQPIQAASIKSAMQKRFGLWDPQMQSSDVFQIYTLQILQQALDRQAILQNQVQALCIQTHELHQYSIPRLFIVLPKLKRFRDKLFKPFAKQFRLFFLCECGEHTMTEDTMIPHEIHLAKHEGYDIDQPSDFFKRYGSHVLTIMKLLKYGCTIAGIVVPPLAHLNLAEGVETVRKSVEVGVNDIGTLVGDATKYIEDLQDHSGGLDTAPGTMDLNAIEALEGADLRQLESFLRASDKGRDLGNLFQVVTPKGHIKWVCSDHFRDSYREFTKQQFKDIVEANRGSYAIERDYVDITLETNIVAQQFYEALIKARGVRSLTVTMNWDVSLDDLRMFEAAIRKTNVVDLIIRGLRNRKSLVDIFNRGRQYDPLLQCMANGKIQQIKIYADDNFYQHTNSSSFTTAPQLRTLSIFSAAAPPGKQLPGSVLFGNLKRCPSLLELDITTDDIHNTFEDLRSKASQCLSLKKLVLYKGFFTILTAEFCYGVIRTAELRTGYLEDISSNERSIFREGYLTGLSVRGIRTEDDEVQLMDIMRRNPKLSTITTECALKRMCAILDAFTDTRKAILAEGGSSVIRRVNLKWAD
ncbi:hypothetical protein BGZ54_005486 [Gamsiella multidivaricata]|nr:hypothetical protein BGZ54_005486 [Gamsiella multidivaricata]